MAPARPVLPMFRLMLALAVLALTLPAPRAQAADPYAPAAQKVAALSAWVFHGGADPTVPVSESRQMVALLFALKAGAKDSGDLKYTEYPGVGHNSWDYAYKEPGLLPWFLSHRRR